MESVRRVDILGCPFDAITFADVLVEIERAIRDKRPLRVVPGNVDFVMKARRDPSFRALLETMDLIVADGVPITWAAGLLGTPIKGRVSGTDLVWRCGEISAKLGVPVALIGAAPGVADRAAAKMRAAFPGARLEAIPTPMKLDAEKNRELVAAVRAVGPAIVLAALGAPRQERWIAENLEATGAQVGIGIGSALDIISGDKPRAAPWMADNGLEWLQRLLQEPRRLGWRYFVEDSPFLWHLAVEVVTRRRRGSVK